MRAPTARVAEARADFSTRHPSDEPGIRLQLLTLPPGDAVGLAECRQKLSDKRQPTAAPGGDEFAQAAGDSERTADAPFLDCVRESPSVLQMFVQVLHFCQQRRGLPLERPKV